jgi:hypothetical protein
MQANMGYSRRHTSTPKHLFFYREEVAPCNNWSQRLVHPLTPRGRGSNTWKIFLWYTSNLLHSTWKCICQGLSTEEQGSMKLPSRSFTALLSLNSSDHILTLSDLYLVSPGHKLPTVWRTFDYGEYIMVLGQRFLTPWRLSIQTSTQTLLSNTILSLFLHFKMLHIRKKKRGLDQCIYLSKRRINKAIFLETYSYKV